ncbi:MAG TPA: prepilin-type N-terminal cleavage/methylation domain-containing protein [Nocardioides sp.]|nr:prepilin-type N-terminal cleavage/methylation domain-containing protein [Nocardioides sp.]
MRRTIDRLQAARREDRGFTLIELLIVIIILGILAAIVVFSVRGISDRGDESACKTEIRTVETAYEAAVAQGEGTQPPTLTSLANEGFPRDAPEYVASVNATTVTMKAGAPCSP